MEVVRSKALALSVLGSLALAGVVACGSDSPPESAEAADVPAIADAAPPAESASGSDNRPPSLRQVVLTPSAPRAADTLTVSFDSADPDGDTVTHELRWSIDGKVLDETGTSLIVPSDHKGAVIAVDVIARDERGETTRDRASVTIANTPPQVEEVSLGPGPDWTAANDVVAKASGSDADGDSLSYLYRWMINGTEAPMSAELLDKRLIRRGDHITLEVRAFDGDAHSAPMTGAPIDVANAPPRILSTPDEIQGEQSLHYRVRAEDPDGDRKLRYRLLQGPDGLTIDWLNGDLAWTPTEAQAGAHLVELEVSDSNGGTTVQRIELRVGDAAVPAAPAP